MTSGAKSTDLILFHILVDFLKCESSETRASSYTCPKFDPRSCGITFYFGNIQKVTSRHIDLLDPIVLYSIRYGEEGRGRRDANEHARHLRLRAGSKEDWREGGRREGGFSQPSCTNVTSGVARHFTAF